MTGEVIRQSRLIRAIWDIYQTTNPGISGDKHRSGASFTSWRKLVISNRIPIMSIKYQPKHVQALFSKSPETIRTWSVDFSSFLSMDANPGSGHRRYTDDDLRVFAHVNIRKGEGASNEQIAAELTNGQRAEPSRDASAIVAADERSELMLLQNQVESLREQISEANTRADRAEGAMAYSDGLHRNEVERLERRLTDTTQQLIEAREEIARLKAK